jgi:hypothetical protein
VSYEAITNSCYGYGWPFGDSHRGQSGADQCSADRLRGDARGGIHNRQGEFTATIAPDGEVINYTEIYSGLQAPVTQSHIHVGQLGVTGSVVIFLCQTAGSPDPTGLAPQCPQEGTVSGVITAANVIAGSQAPQQLAAGDLAAVITAIRAGAAYANVHTQVSPGGEIRGQIRTIAK